jgi:hypothetical protein
MHCSPVEMTPHEIAHLLGELNQLVIALQHLLENGQIQLPTIRIDDGPSEVGLRISKKCHS